MFWALIYLGRALLSPVAGLLVSKIGTARGTLISNLIYIPAMVALGFMSNLGMPSILTFAICMGVSGVIYEICYYVEFSKVKSPQHAGKEIGYMNILEKLTITTSPIIGGLIALFFWLPVTMWIAGVLFAFSAVPLFKKGNNSETRQKISIKGFPWRTAISSVLASSSLGFDIVATSLVWGLFITIFIFPGSGSDIYVILGALSSLTILVTIITSLLYGKIIDNSRGGTLLGIGVISNSLVHLFRIFSLTPAGAVGVNIVNEAATTAQNMAFLRGIFDVSDISGHRIMYLVLVTMMSNIGAMIACLVFVACDLLLGGILGFRAFFIVASIMILGVGAARFPVYRR
jgi:MFS family permease